MTGDVAWEPGLTEEPPTGTWIRALTSDGAFVTPGLTGVVVGKWQGTPIVLWDNGTRSTYPIKHMARVDKPRARSYYTTQPSTCWTPDRTVDGTPDGVSNDWVWITGQAS